MKSLLFDISTFIYLIPLILGLSKFPFLNKIERNFFLFVIASAFCSLLAYFTSSVGNNVYVLYLYNALEIILVPIFLLNALDKQKHKWYWLAGVFFGLALIFFEAFMREGGIEKYNNISLTYAAFGLSILSIRHLLKLRFDPSIYDLSKSSVFWFTLGIGVYYLGNILIFSFTRIFQDQDLQVLSNLSLFRLSLNYISVSMFIGGFVIIKPKTSSFSG